MKGSTQHSKLTAILALLVAMVSIQSSVSIAKKIFAAVGPGGTAALRISLAALVLSVFFRPWKVKLNSQQIWAVLGYGFSLGLMNYTFYISVERIPLGLAVAIEFIGPLTVAVLFSKRLFDFIWVVLAALGILLIVPFKQTAHGVDLLGVLFALLAGIGWGAYIYFGHQLGSKLKGGLATTYGMIVGALFVLPVGMATAKASIFQVSILPLALLMAVVSSVIPYSLEMAALRRMPAKNFSILMSAEPAVAALAGLVWMHEKLTFHQWIAIACVMTASLGSSLLAAPKRKGTVELS